MKFNDMIITLKWKDNQYPTCRKADRLFKRVIRKIKFAQFWHHEDFIYYDRDIFIINLSSEICEISAETAKYLCFYLNLATTKIVNDEKQIQFYRNIINCCVAKFKNGDPFCFKGSELILAIGIIRTYWHNVCTNSCSIKIPAGLYDE